MTAFPTLMRDISHRILDRVPGFVRCHTDGCHRAAGINAVRQADDTCLRVIMVGQLARNVFHTDMEQAVFVQNLPANLCCAHASCAVHPVVSVVGAVDLGLRPHGKQHRRYNQNPIVTVKIVIKHGRFLSFNYSHVLSLKKAKGAPFFHYMGQI